MPSICFWDSSAKILVSIMFGMTLNLLTAQYFNIGCFWMSVNKTKMSHQFKNDF